MTSTVVNEMSEELAKDYVGFKLSNNTEVPSNLTAKTLRRLAADLERQHEELFKNMLKSVTSREHNNEVVFQSIAKEMFADKVVNWGRIVVLYAFAGQMAVHCDRNNMKTESRKVVHWLTTFVNRELSSWIVQAGGWDAFNEYFKEKKDESSMWWGNVLCTFGLVAGAALVFAR